MAQKLSWKERIAINKGQLKRIIETLRAKNGSFNHESLADILSESLKIIRKKK